MIEERRVALDDFNSIPSTPENGSGERPHSWTPIDLVEIGAQEPERPTISGLVYPGRRHVFSGEPETLKTWAADALCAEQIRSGAEVVYVDFEMGVHAQAGRMRALGLSDEELRRFLYMTPNEALTDVLPSVETFLEFVRPPLVVIDAFTGVLAANNVDENSNVEVENFYQAAITPIQRHGAAVVLIDHVTKDKEKRGRYSIASSRKLGATDVHLGFELVRPFSRGHTGLAKIRTHKDRPGTLMRPYAGEIELTSSGETVSWQIRVAADEDTYHRFRPTVLMERVSMFVSACVELPSVNAVEEAVRGKKEYIREAIECLVADGYLVEEEGARNARLLRSVTPFRDSEEAA